LSLLLLGIMHANYGQGIIHLAEKWAMLYLANKELVL
jgi:hypothetical protein